MVDSRSYAWLIDYGEVEDAHVFKDPAKLEASICFMYTTDHACATTFLG